MTRSQIDLALKEGYSHDEVMDYLSKKDPSMSPKIQQARDEGYSSEEVLEYLGGPKERPQSRSRDIINLEKGVGRKAGRLAAQALPVAADVASLPLTGTIMGIQGAASFAEKNRLGAVERNKWRQENPEEAKAQKRKSDPYGFGEYLDTELEKQQKGIDEKGIIPEWFSDQDWTPGGLVKTALEKAGVDMEPEDIAETAVKWATAVKNPKQLGSYLRNPAKIIQSPKEALSFAKSLLPSGKEAARGIGAATIMEAAGDEFGPLGSLAAGIVGDYTGGGVAGAARGVGKFVKAPIQTTKQIMARGAVRLTPKDKLDIQKKIVEDFRNAGIQADIGTITDSNLLRGLQARLGASSLMGKELENLVKTQKEQILSQYGQLANQLGRAKFSSLQEAGEELVAKTQEIRNADRAIYRDLYQKSIKGAEGGQVLPQKLGDAVKNLQKQLKPGTLKSTEQKSVLNYLEDLSSDLFDAEGSVKAANVKDLINNKIALGEIIDYEVQGGTKQLLKGIAKDLDTAILEYGAQNKDFAKNYKTANSHFAEHAKDFRNKNINAVIQGKDPMQLMNKMNAPQGIREIGKVLNRTKEGRELFNDLRRFKLDEIVGKNMVDSATEQLKLGKFTNILEKGKNREIVRELLTPAAFARLSRLQRMTGKLAESAYKFLNVSKSGSVAVDAAFYGKVLSDVGNLIGGNPWPLVKTGGLLAASRGLTKLLADPEFLKMVEENVLAATKAGPSGLMKMASKFADRFFPTLKQTQNGPTNARSMSPQLSSHSSGMGPQASLSSSQVSATSPPSSGSRIARSRMPSSSPSKTGFPESEIGSISPLNNEIILQGSKDPQLLLQKAKEHKKEFIDDVHSLIKGVPGAKLYGVRTKEAASLQKKVSRGRMPEQIPDYIGARVLVKDSKAMDKVLDRLQKKNPVEVDDFLNKPKGEWGYRAVHSQLRIDGMTGELQIVPEEISKLQPWMHKYYKKWQNQPAVKKQSNPEYSADVAKVRTTTDKAYHKFMAKD